MTEMKKVTFCIFLLALTFNLSAQQQSQPMFPKVKLSSLDSLIEGNWYYQYSFNSEHTFDNPWYGSEEYNVAERMDFYQSSKRTLKKISQDNKQLLEFRNSSCLKTLEYFPDYKGSSSYLKLRSKETDSEGYLVRCYIDFWAGEHTSGKGEEPSLSIISLTSGLMVIEKKSNDGKKLGYHVYVKGELEEFLFSN